MNSTFTLECFLPDVAISLMFFGEHIFQEVSAPVCHFYFCTRLT